MSMKRFNSALTGSRRIWIALSLTIVIITCGVLISGSLQPNIPSQQPFPRGGNRVDRNKGFHPVAVVKPQPAITGAPTANGEEMEQKLAENDLVIGVVVNGTARAYPINMLTGPKREIINDTLGGRAIAATW